MTTVNATEVQNNFGITKNGKEVARLISKQQAIEFLTDSLVGVLNSDYDDKAMRKERMEANESIG